MLGFYGGEGEVIRMKCPNENLEHMCYFSALIKMAGTFVTLMCDFGVLRLK